jgi:hypothetical protein
MRMRTIGSVTAVLMASLAVAAPPAQAVSDYSSLVVDGGIGSSAYYGPTYTTSATEDAVSHVVTLQAVHVSSGYAFPTYYVTPPTGQQLTASTDYPIAASPSATAASLSSPYGCTGTLHVHDLTHDAVSGAVTSLGLNFEVTCPGASLPFLFAFRFHSTVPDKSAAYVMAVTNSYFPPVDPGQTGSPTSFTYRNVGPLATHVSAVAVQGDNPSDFTVANEGCTTAPVPAGGSCTIQVSFTPTASYLRKAVLRVTDDTMRGAQELALAASAYGPPGTVLTPSATVRSDGLQLRWQPPLELGGRPLQYVELLRGETAQTLQPLGQAAAGVLTFADRLGSDTAPIPDHTYVYGFRGHNDRGDGPVVTLSAHVPASAVPVTTDAVVTVEGAAGALPYPSSGYVYKAADGATVGVSAADYGEWVTASAAGQPALTLYATSGQSSGELAVGSYADGIQVSPPTQYSSNCSYPAEAALDVTEVAYDSGGQLARLAASYVRRCTSAGPAVTGVIRWHSDLPYGAASVTTPAADFPVKSGAATPMLLTYRNRGTTTITLGAVTLQPTTASGSTSGWALTQDGCAGQVLAAGAQCTATVSVTPVSVGHKEVLVSFADDTTLGAHVRKVSAYSLAPPVAPKVSASGAGTAGTKISWVQTFSPPIAAPTSWLVYRKVGSGSYSLVKTVSAAGYPTAGSWTDPDLRSGTRYYSVRAVNVAGAGALSPALAVRYGPLPPRSVVATGLTRRVVVTWAAPLSSFTPYPLKGYVVYKASSTGSLVKVGTRLKTDLPMAFPVTGLAPGQKATIRVRALYGSTYGPVSSAATATATSASLMFVRGDYGLRPGALFGRGLTGGRVVPLDQPRTWSYMYGVFHSSPPAFSPNRQYVVCSAQNGAAGYPYQLFVRRTDGSGNPRFITSGASSAYSPAVSPDGKWVAFTRAASDGHAHLYRVPWTGGAPTLIPNSKDLDEPSWSRDGKSLYASRIAPATRAVVRLTLGGSRTTIGSGLNESPVVSPDGKSVAFYTRSTSNVSALKVLTVSTGAIKTIVSSTGGWATRPSWTPTSSTIYFTVTSSTTGAALLRRVSRTGSGLTSLAGLGVGAHYVLYEQW